MKPESFIKSYKCDCFQPNNNCNCMVRGRSSDVFMKNVVDTAESLVEVMKLCGVWVEKSKKSVLVNVIVYYFLHYREIVYRIDAVPKKRLNKEGLIADLALKCCLKRTDAQLVCSIVKRAFQAFYYGTGLGGVPYIPLKEKLTHTSECLWAHAGQRTAQIYASYCGMFYVSQKHLEGQIKSVYQQLCHRMSKRNVATHDQECTCIDCVKRIARETLKVVRVTTGMHAVDDAYEAAFLKEQERIVEQSTNDETVTIKETHCICPSLKMSAKDYIYDQNAELSHSASNQDPFECRWMPISHEDFEADEDNVNAAPSGNFFCSPCHLNAQDEPTSELCCCACKFMQ